MRRAVITGMGVISCIGNDKGSVLNSLREGRSGITFSEEYKEMGLRSQVAGRITLDPNRAEIDRKARRFMGDAAAYAYLSMEEAIQEAGLTEEEISNPRTGLVTGSGGGSPSNQMEAVDTLRTKGIRRVGPYMVPRTMNSTLSACLATPFKIKGINYSISSACATSAHCIGHALELIQADKQDIVFAGGGEEEGWTLSMMFDAMGALSTKYNDAPQTASRPYDVTRDGFVIAGGGGIVVVEELEHALRRGANILAELVGYGATSDGVDMVAPSGEGAARCMKQALAGVKGSVDLINAHGTSTPAGDIRELEAIKAVFGNDVPLINSTKSQTGHSLGATGVHEVIYCLLMMKNNFVSPTINTSDIEEFAKTMPIVTTCRENVELKTVMSNSFGFGGTNATLVLQKYQG